ncbi:MAG: valine--tRNA ligase [bacterium]
MTMEPRFEHNKVENDLYKAWEEAGVFKPSNAKATDGKPKKPYTILMPPPNANASLHAGHGMYTVDDILIRYKRMQGYSALWVPGLDHAGFETQFVYEKQLAKEGRSRLEFDRQTLYDNVYKFVKDNSGQIIEQFRRLGFSADWSRTVFTLDPHVLERAFTTFSKMVVEKLIYRSDYLVNYCTNCGTSLAELEILHDEREDKLYFLKYGPVTVATVRPETLFGDTAVAVHPKDKRYAKLVGTMVPLPLTTRMIPIVADEMVDVEFATGAVKITPAHDQNDFEAGKRHNLEMIKVINQMGRMTLPKDVTTPEIDGMKVKAAREKTVEALQAAGAIDKIDEHYLHAVTVCYKCKRDMEPMTVPNWYIKVETLKPPVVAAIKTGKTKIFPARYEKHLLDWMEIMHDWPISRQVAWGIRIPAWYDVLKNPTIYATFLDAQHNSVSGEVGELLEKHSFSEIETGLQTISAPKDATYVVSKNKPDGQFLQETDTFDTWFSSGQWPLVTLKDDENATRHPTDTMATMVDILRIWVSRMMMFGIYLNGETPFKNVYLWSKVTDSKGAKMSKSKGNVVNPLILVDKYGADAFRMSLIFGNGDGDKVPLSDDKVRAMRNFANKIWNMARFFLMMNEDKNIEYQTSATSEIEKLALVDIDKEILGKLAETVKVVNNSLEKFRFGEAADAIYHFMWDEVAAIYIESIKDREDKDVALTVFYHVFTTSLKLLHPFMPFVTEAVWKELPGTEGMLVTAEYPTN